MSIKTILYQEARMQMKAGDVIAFSGKGDFSEIIKGPLGPQYLTLVLSFNLNCL
jgi:hypothetical protein